MRVLLWIWLRHVPRQLKPFLLYFLNARFTVTVAAIIQDDEGRLLLLDHSYRSGSTWAIPAGFVLWRENPEVAIVREVREETGWNIAVERLLRAIPDAGVPNGMRLFYRARIVSGDFRPSPEVRGYRWEEQATMGRFLR